MNTTDSIALETMPFLTSDLPGVGGAIKTMDEDFVVEEIPLYPASGAGTHTYFTIEKRGQTTLNAIQSVARALGCHPRDIGYAGLKDAHGITRQTLSVEHVDPARVEALDLGRMSILSVTRHTNKIKLGHLGGNRFEIRIRATPDAPFTTDAPFESAKKILEVLARRGVPNYFGPQRFGARGDNHQIGRAILLDHFDEAVAMILGRPGPRDHGEAQRARELFDAGDLEGCWRTWRKAFPEQARLARAMLESGGNARKAWRAVHQTLRKLYFSAFQSDLFNRVLAKRIGAIDRLENGDIAYKHRNGACFRVEDAAVEQPRCDAFEISATGPLFGRRMTEPSGRPSEIETAVLSGSGLEREWIHSETGSRLDGARRPLRVPLQDVTTDAAGGDGIQIGFVLPPGAYATAVTRELMKNESANGR